MDDVLTQLADKIWAKFLAWPGDKRFCKSPLPFILCPGRPGSYPVISS